VEDAPIGTFKPPRAMINTKGVFVRLDVGQRLYSLLQEVDVVL